MGKGVHPGDPHRLGPGQLGSPCDRRHGRDFDPAAVGPLEHRERQAQVRHGAGERAEAHQVAEPARRPVGELAVPGPRHAILRGLEPEHPAEMTRDPDRSRGVAADLERREPGRHRGGAAARASPRRAADIPRIVAAAEDRAVALPVVAEQGDVRLPEDDRAGPLHACGDGRVGGGDVVPGRRIAGGVPQPLDVEDVLDGHRHAVERAPQFAAGERLVGGDGARARVRVRDDDGVEGRVESLDAAGVQVVRLDRADPAVADRLGELAGGREARAEVRAHAGSGFPAVQPSAARRCR